MLAYTNCKRQSPHRRGSTQAKSVKAESPGATAARKCLPSSRVRGHFGGGNATAETLMTLVRNTQASRCALRYPRPWPGSALGLLGLTQQKYGGLGLSAANMARKEAQAARKICRVSQTLSRSHALRPSPSPLLGGLAGSDAAHARGPRCRPRFIKETGAHLAGDAKTAFVSTGSAPSSLRLCSSNRTPARCSVGSKPGRLSPQTLRSKPSHLLSAR